LKLRVRVAHHEIYRLRERIRRGVRLACLFAAGMSLVLALVWATGSPWR
jgi:hypothetical protein